MHTSSDKFFLTIYAYLVCLLNGWQINSFIIIYFNLNEPASLFLFNEWLKVQSEIIFIFGPVIMLGLFFFLARSSALILNVNDLKYHYVAQSFLTGFITWNYFSVQLGYHVDLIELVSVVLAIVSINYLSKAFNVAGQPAWFHPTTRSTFFISSVLCGISLIILTQIFKNEYSFLLKFMVIILIIEIFRIYTRVKFLTKTSTETNRIARLILGKYGIYFSVRMVIGIFMPLGYGIYAMWGNIEFIKAAAITVIIGELLERILFVYIVSEIKTNGIKTEKDMKTL